MKCKNCNFENNAEAKFCIKCGSPLAEAKLKTGKITVVLKKIMGKLKNHIKKLKNSKFTKPVLIVLGLVILFFVLKQPIANLLPIKPPDMVFVKGGTFKMGSNNGDSDEKPVHTVTVSDFYIGKYEVTQKQWRDVMGTNPSYFSGCDDCPVEQVSWNDVQKFIKKLNKKNWKKYRLPTEAEWEYAARGGKKSKGYKYAGSDNIGNVAWYSENSYDKTHTVGTKRANELGIYDMTGNVWEWCNDWYDGDYYGKSPKSNPKGPKSGSGRVNRGGGRGTNAGCCRVADRIYNSPGYSTSMGFRLVVSP